MRNIRWDESVKYNTLCLVKALLLHADNEFEDEKLKTTVHVEWVTENKLRVTGFEDKQTSGKRKRKVEVGTKKEHLVKLLKEIGKTLKIPKLKDGSSTSLQNRELDEIQTALDCLKKLGVREDEKSAKNQGYWKFTLTLTHQTATQEQNLEVVDRKWREHPKTNSPETAIDWPAGSELVHDKQDTDIDIDDLVQEVRDKIKISIQKRCGMMKVLDMTQPIGVGDIYTEVNILEKITGRRRKEIVELSQDFDPNSEEFDRFGLGRVTEARVPGIQAVERYSKLMVLGKPGAGKTTFLKYLAIQCISGDFLANKVPIFITLKEFAEAENYCDLLTFVSDLLAKEEVNTTQVLRLLKFGRMFFLFDGLDEVKEEDIHRVIIQISKFIESFSYSLYLKEDSQKIMNFLLDKFKTCLLKIKNINDYEDISNFRSEYFKYLNNQLSLSCRISDKIKNFFETNLSLQKIHDGIKDINKLIDSFTIFIGGILPEDYIELFRQQSCKRSYENNFIITCRIAAREEKFEKFVEVEVADFDDAQIEKFVTKWFQLRETDDSQIFMQQIDLAPPIKELATNPLLLTLLCLLFQDSAEFPHNRSELYKEGVAILLKKWDGQRRIKRDRVYQKLSPPRKEDLLSQIAMTTFDSKNYFFRKIEIEKYIADYIRNLPDAKTDPEVLHLDSEAVLKSIEAQHGLLVERALGIYSFSHLTFQEYFTARKIVNNSDPQTLERALQSLASHMTEVRWREVILLTIGLLSSADRLLQLMKQQVDKLLARSQHLQNFLTSVQQKSVWIQSSYKPVVMRAFVFANELALNTDLCFSFCKEFKFNYELSLDYILNSAHESFRRGIVDNRLENRLILNTNLNPTLILNQALNIVIEPNLKQELEKLQDQITDTYEQNNCNQWWETNGLAYVEQLKTLMNQYRIGVGYDWQLNEQQKKLLKQYYNANLLLAECLNMDCCYVSLEVRQWIQNTLLLPTVEIKKYKTS
jgi:predicted NACHT family NTPase